MVVENYWKIHLPECYDFTCMTNTTHINSCPSQHALIHFFYHNSNLIPHYCFQIERSHSRSCISQASHVTALRVKRVTAHR